MISQHIRRGPQNLSSRRRQCALRSIRYLLVGVIGVLVAAASLNSSARAAVILTTSTPPGVPLEVRAGDVSQTLLLSLLGDGTGDVIAGWQFTLLIVPEAGATGTLSFESAKLPDNNYILGGDSIGLGAMPTATIPGALTFFDLLFSDPVDVPGAPGAGALVLTFSASADARGNFGLYAVGGLGFNEWVDGAFTANTYANIPNSSNADMTRIASIRVVPEPTALCATLTAAIAAPFFLRRRRLR